MSHVCPFRGKAADFSGGSRALVGILQRSVFSLRRVLLIERGVHFIYDYNTCVYIYIYIYIYTCIYVCIHITYKHVCYDVILCNLQLCNHISMYVYVYTYIYIYAYMYTHSSETSCGYSMRRSLLARRRSRLRGGRLSPKSRNQTTYVCMYVCVYVYVCMCV